MTAKTMSTLAWMFSAVIAYEKKADTDAGVGGHCLRQKQKGDVTVGGASAATASGVSATTGTTFLANSRVARFQFLCRALDRQFQTKRAIIDIARVTRSYVELGECQVIQRR